MKDHHHSPASLSELCDCLETKRRALEQYLANTEFLESCLTSQDLPEAERLLSQRQGLIVTIDQFDARIQDLRSSHPFNQEGLPDAQKKRISVLLDSIKDISERAQVVDKACMGRMTDWRGLTKSQLSRIRDSLNAVRGYAQKRVRPPKFLDVVR
jgi:hypothetical protein